MKNKTKSLIKRISCLVAVVCILGALCIPCFATDSNIVINATIRTLDFDMLVSQDDIIVDSYDGHPYISFDIAKHDLLGEFVCDFSPMTFNIEGLYNDFGISLIDFYIGDIMESVEYDYVLSGQYHYDDTDIGEYVFLSGTNSHFNFTGFDLYDYDSLAGWSTVTFDCLTLRVSSSQYSLGDIQVNLTSYYIPAESGGDDVDNQTGILSAVLGVFDAVGTWIADSVNSMSPMFYSAETGLTFLGVLGVAGLAFAVIFLVIGFITRFLRFRG